MSQQDEATAVAYPNIALIKYWGKRDGQLMLPMTGSLSLTLNIHATTTTVRLDSSLSDDQITLNGVAMDSVASKKVSNFLTLIRLLAGTSTFAHVITHNDGPTAAGLASSASGFAALAAAGAQAYGLKLSLQELSRLARRGSGSACRSIYGGLVIWHAGQDNSSSYAEPLSNNGLNLSMVLAIVHAGQKTISSREAMQRTVNTSPFYPAWVEQTSLDLVDMQAAISSGDFQRIGELTELSAMRMHATMLSANPPIRYMASGTLEILDLVARLRSKGVAVYATMDAGPNVKLLCQQKDEQAVLQALHKILPDNAIVLAHAGSGVQLLKEGFIKHHD